MTKSYIKKVSFKLFLKGLHCGVARSDAGSWFQAWGPANEKALSPNLYEVEVQRSCW